MRPRQDQAAVLDARHPDDAARPQDAAHLGECADRVLECLEDRVPQHRIRNAVREPEGVDVRDLEGRVADALATCSGARPGEVRLVDVDAHDGTHGAREIDRELAVAAPDVDQVGLVAQVGQQEVGVHRGSPLRGTQRGIDSCQVRWLISSLLCTAITQIDTSYDVRGDVDRHRPSGR